MRPKIAGRKRLPTFMSATLLFFFERAESRSILPFDKLLDALIFPRAALQKRKLVAFCRAVTQGGLVVGYNQLAVAVRVLASAEREQVFFSELIGELVCLLHQRRSWH